MDIAGFLRRYPPFDELSDERLATVAAAVEIEHVAAGATILQQRGEPASGLYLVRKGAVELLDDGRVLDLLGEGELFGQFSLLAHEGPTVTVRADEDTLLYVIPEAVADEVLAWVRAVARRGECTVLMITHKFREVMAYADLASLKSEAAVKQAGKMRVEGREYVVADGDVMHFRFNV